MTDTPDKDGQTSTAARLSLICAVAGCLCMGGAFILWLGTTFGIDSGATAATIHMIARVSAAPIGAAFIAALVTIGQLMASRARKTSESHVRAALVLCLVWTLSMIILERVTA